MRNERRVIVLKDKETGKLLPLAGIWLDDGSDALEWIIRKAERDDGVVAVKAVLTEL